LVSIGRDPTAVAGELRAGRFMGNADWTGAFTIVFGSALVGSLFSSDAWNNVTFAAAEVQNPKRNLPLALVLGTGLVTTLYVWRTCPTSMSSPSRARRTARRCWSAASARDAGPGGHGGR
jgi:APA family basic amino acid/polyamine antiporter